MLSKDWWQEGPGLEHKFLIYKFHNIVIRRSLSTCHGKSKAHKFWPKCFEMGLSHYTCVMTNPQ